jgi:hypothetical protein
VGLRYCRNKSEMAFRTCHLTPRGAPSSEAEIAPGSVMPHVSLVLRGPVPPSTTHLPGTEVPWPCPWMLGETQANLFGWLPCPIP